MLDSKLGGISQENRNDKKINECYINVLNIVIK
jgi:hypothetical protein